MKKYCDICKKDTTRYSKSGKCRSCALKFSEHSIHKYGHSLETKKRISNKNKGNPSPMKGKTFKHTEEAKRKIKKNNAYYWKDKKFNKEHKEKLSKAKIGLIPWIVGKKHTRKTKKKMSEKAKLRIGKLASNW